MFLVLSIIILVAVFNILSSLIMLVRANTKDIAILRTMGATRMSLMRIFMTVGTLIGALGIIAGLGLGFLILHFRQWIVGGIGFVTGQNLWDPRSEEHTSELQSLMRISYAVFCLKKKKKHTVRTIGNIY